MEKNDVKQVKEDRPSKKIIHSINDLNWHLIMNQIISFKSICEVLKLDVNNVNNLRVD